MAWRVTAIRLVFAANVLVEGAAGLYCVYSSQAASRLLFVGMDIPSMVMRLLGAFWLSIALLSAIGISRTVRFSVVLVLQLIYKSIWLIAVALPAVVRSETDLIPTNTSALFFIWVIFLPFVIPWRYLLQSR